MSTLFGAEGQVGHKPKRATYPPPPWVVRQLTGLGIDPAEIEGKDARYCFALLNRLQDERQSEGKKPAADDHECQGPDGWPGPERAAMGADLAADAADETLTRERILSAVEMVVPALTRAQLYRVAKGITKVIEQEGKT